MQNVGVLQTANYTAYIYPKKIIICSRFQCVRLFCDNHMKLVNLDEIKVYLLSGKAKTLTDIVDLSNAKLSLESCTKPCN